MAISQHKTAAGAPLGPAAIPVDRRQLQAGIRDQALHRFRSAGGLAIEDQGVMLLQGGSDLPLYNTDNDTLFRQEPFFHHLFGVNEPGCWGAMDTRSSKAFLFIPRLPAEYAVWYGAIPDLEQVREKYAVDECHYVDQLAEVLASLAPPALHVLSGVNSDSGLPFPPPTFPGIESFTVEARALWPVLCECRVIKTDEELEVLRYACSAASAAHVAVMQACKPGMMEYQLESLYLHTIYSGYGCRTAHYTPIFASGPNAAVLHYGHAGAPNDRRIGDGDLVLADAGAEYHRYAADITCTFPANGRFTPEQRLIYEAVLAANRAVVGSMQPGVSWVDMHLLAERTILEGLKAGGLLRGDVDAMLAARLGAVFMPHGLGHFLGVDTHDVGGYLPSHPPRPEGPGLSKLRTARVLQERMVITVEPGCYFCPSLLEPALQDPVLSQFLVEERLRPLMGMGGVRIEDDVIVLPGGAATMCDVPRTVEEVEGVCGGVLWPYQ